MLLKFFWWGLILALLPFRAMAVEPLVLGAVAQQPLSGALALYRDSSGQKTLDDVLLNPPRFQSIPGGLSLGFSRDAVWLRFTVVRPSTQPAAWWLEVDQSILDDVRLYVPDPKAPENYTERRAGAIVDWAAREVADRRSVFKLDLPPDVPTTLYVRISSRTALSAHLSLWQPEAWMAATFRSNHFWGVYYGAFLLMLLFYVAFWRWTGERIHALYVAYLGINLINALLSGGWFGVYLPMLGGGLAISLLGVGICVALVISLHFNAGFLEMRRQLPMVTRYYLGHGYVLGILGGIGILAGHYEIAMPWVQSMSLITLCVTLWISIRLVQRGHPNARIFLWAFGIYYLAIAVRFLRNLGWIEPAFWSDHSYQIGSIMHLLVMSFGIFAGYNRLKREKAAAEALAQSEAQRREEQRSFLAMVSHEFRTPLSIIAAAAENLSHNPTLDPRGQARCEKIMRAGARMTQLMDSYLSAERLESFDQALRLAPCDLGALCARVVDEFDGHEGALLRVWVHDPVTVEADAALLGTALRNLLANARKHSPINATVQVSVQAWEGGGEITVEDAGEGIPADELPHLFKRYFRGRGALERPGAGLGLHLVDLIVRRHGGTVSVQSTLGQGSRFTLRLPAKPPAEAMSAR